MQPKGNEVVVSVLYTTQDLEVFKKELWKFLNKYRAKSRLTEQDYIKVSRPDLLGAFYDGVESVKQLLEPILTKED